MRLNVHLVTGGVYIRAGDELPPGFELPPHLEAFVVDPSQLSRAGDPSFSSGETSGGSFGAGARLAKPATDYSEGEEEFVPTRQTKMGEEIRRAHQRKERKKL